MKSVIISILLLLFVTLIITLAGVYTNNITEKIRNISEEISVSSPHDDNEERINQIKDIWENSSGILMCLYDFREIDAIECSIIELECVIKSGKYEDVSICKGSLLHCIENLKEISRISLKRIL